MGTETSQFNQQDSESLHEMWKRFKDSLKRCPQYGHEVDIFYNGSHGLTKSIVNSSSGGSFIKKTIHEAFALLEELALNSYNWQMKRQLKKHSGMFKLDAFASLVSKVDVLSH